MFIDRTTDSTSVNIHKKRITWRQTHLNIKVFAITLLEQ